MCVYAEALVEWKPYWESAKSGNFENAWSWAEATATILFRPNFAGQGPTINMYAWDVHNGEFEHKVEISDNTIGLVIGAMWQFDSALPITYNNWNPQHIYALNLYASSGAQTEPEWGFPGGFSTASADIIFSTVPEPSILPLLGIGLAGLIALCRRDSTG